ncbi:MAG TPA: sigma-70 family RNA polymerase sigma factor [Trebonia sp.]
MRDRELAASIVDGDPDALAEAYDKYADLLWSYCRSLVSDADEAAEAVADTFVITASRLEVLPALGRFRAWLYAVARSECLRRLRSSRVKAAIDEGPRLRRAAAVLSTGEQQQLRALLSVAFGGLERAERDIMQMVWHGLDLAEVAAVLGIPRNEAYVLFAGARDQLEASVGVLLMGWSGRVDCGEFQAMLAGHDRRLTADLRTRLCRHIDKCGICAERYRQEMRPSLLLGLSIGALLSEAGGARATPSRAPRGLWHEVSRMTSERHPDAVWHRLIGGRRVSFDANGFPRQMSDDGTNRAPRVAFAAVGTMAVAVTATGVATHAHHTATSAMGSPSVAAVSSDVTAAGQAPSTSHATAAGQGKHRAVTHGNAAPQPRVLAPSATPSSMPTLGSSAVGVSGRGASPTRSTVTASPTGGTASGSSSPSEPRNGGSSGASPSGSPSPSQSQNGGSSGGNGGSSGGPSASPSSSPSSTTAGTLSVSTSNIALAVGGSGSFTLTANGGPVTWSISAPRQLLADVSLSQSSGTLEAGQSVTITVTVAGLAAVHEPLTISPGGQTVTVDIALL